MQASSTLEPREYLDKLIKERRDDYASLSRLLGRNAAYIQQFIKRGTPKRLDEEDRRTLARYFGITESALGAREEQGDLNPSVRTVPRLDVRASAGAGATVPSERASGIFGFDERWLRELAQGGIDGLSTIRVQGDSMEPTLSDGDEIMVDRNDGANRLRDGIYVLRLEDDLLVKRIARTPRTGAIGIRSDNASYPAWEDVEADSVQIVGRVIWAGKRVR